MVIHLSVLVMVLSRVGPCGGVVERSGRPSQRPATPGEGVFWLGRVALAGVAPLEQRRPGRRCARSALACGTLGDRGQQWPSFAWCDLYPIMHEDGRRPGDGLILVRDRGRFRLCQKVPEYRRAKV